MLKGKAALITGGSRGIGAAAAIKLAQNGADIAFIYGGNETSANLVKDEIISLGVKCIGYKCDVSNYESTKIVVEQILKDFTNIDILINNAGIVRDSFLLSMDEKNFDDVIDVNLKGTFNMMKHLYRHMMKRKSGRIINISSVVGIAGNAGQSNYAASKAGIIGLTKSIAKELARRNITCNVIAPGYIQTDMTDSLSENLKSVLIDSIPMKRVGKPEDVAELILFLASDFSGYITGETIKVDGGLTM